MNRKIAQCYLGYEGKPISNDRWDALVDAGLIKGFLIPGMVNMMYGKKHLDTLDDRAYALHSEMAAQIK